VKVCWVRLAIGQHDSSAPAFHSVEKWHHPDGPRVGLLCLSAHRPEWVALVWPAASATCGTTVLQVAALPVRGIVLHATRTRQIIRLAVSTKAMPWTDA
jgi:hypothetical protein